MTTKVPDTAGRVDEFATPSDLRKKLNTAIKILACRHDIEYLECRASKQGSSLTCLEDG